MNSRKRLDAYFCEVVFNPTSEEGRRMIATIYNYLSKFNLNRSHTAEAILQEGYIRCVFAIERRDVIIGNNESYLKRVLYNYVRELSRHQRKEISADYLEQIDVESSSVDPGLHLYCQQIQAEIDKLPPLEAHILRLRELERMPYKEISIFLEGKGLGKFSPAALRQKRSRIMKELRENSGWKNFE